MYCGCMAEWKNTPVEHFCRACCQWFLKLSDMNLGTSYKIVPSFSGMLHWIDRRKETSEYTMWKRKQRQKERKEWIHYLHLNHSLVFLKKFQTTGLCRKRCTLKIDKNELVLKMGSIYITKKIVYMGWESSK